MAKSLSILAHQIAYHALILAADGHRILAMQELDRAYGMFGDLAEVELCQATDTTLPVMGTRAQPPKTVWTDLIQQVHGKDEELDPVLTEDLEAARMLRDLAMESTSTYSKHGDLDQWLQILQSILMVKVNGASLLSNASPAPSSSVSIPSKLTIRMLCRICSH